MIENPTTAVRQGTLLVYDNRTHHPRANMHFWGGVLIAVAIMSMVIFPEFRSTDPTQLMVPAVTASVGTALLLFAGRSRQQPIPLAELRPEQGLLQILPAASSQFSDIQRQIWLSEIHDVLFGMTRFPMNQGSPVTIEAFSVCVRLYDGSILPVVEATPRKGPAFLVAQELSEALGVPIHQTGLGL
ncbi:MAG: hypothetical protein AAFS10_27425 [Myxococcota bacterium]